MEQRRLIRWTAYGVASVLSLLAGFYLTFPAAAVAQRVSAEVRSRTGGAVELELSDLGVWWMSGIEADNVRVLLHGLHDEPIAVTIDALRMRVQLLPLFLMNLGLSAEVELGEGEIDAVVAMGGESLEGNVSIDKIDFGSPPVLGLIAGLPVEGVLNAEGRFKLATDPKASQLEATVTLRDAALGPGAVKGFKIPSQLGLGQIDMVFEVSDGKLALAKFQQNASTKGPPQLVIDELSGDGTLRPRLASTTYEACAKVKLDEAFVKKTPGLSDALQLVTVPPPMGPGLRKDAQGYYHASFGGTFSSAPRSRRRLCGTSGRK